MRISSLFLALSVLLVTSSGCLKNDTCSPRSVSSEADDIEEYASLIGMNTSTHSSGLYYEILDPGTGDAPEANSTIFIRYTGKLLDGTVFDERTDASTTGWPLSGLIEAWRIGVPLIREGGHIRLLVPSSLAYGCANYGAIPGNSILYFDIELVDVQ